MKKIFISALVLTLLGAACQKKTITNTTTANTNVNTSVTTRVNVYQVAIGDDGKTGTKIGCGDSLVAVEEQVTIASAARNDIDVKIQAALEKLFLLHETNNVPPGSGDLYNALTASQLTVDSVSFTNGLATVKLSGTLQLGGECDNPRVENQITKTVAQFPEVTSTSIILNGKPLNDALSLK